MGEVIRKSAATEDIVSDGRASFVNAQAKGGLYKTAADKTLKPGLVLFDAVDGKWVSLNGTLAPLVAAHHSRDDRADALIGRIGDAVWNDIGRPAAGVDGSYELVFPSGITFYTDGPDDEQPERMELLADLLESGVLARLDPAQAKSYAQELRDEAAELEKSLDAIRKPRIRLAMYSRMRTAAGKNVHSALARYKRLLRAHDVSEADIHTVIPDRPTAAKKSEPAPDPGAPPVPPLS